MSDRKKFFCFGIYFFCLNQDISNRQQKKPSLENLMKACIIFISGGPTWIRTRDQPVMSRGLYR